MASQTKITNPPLWKGPLGSKAEISQLKDTVDTATSGEASREYLFPHLTEQSEANGGVPPKRTDFNALFKMLGDHSYFLQQGGFYQYDAGVTYKRYAIVQHEGVLYQSLKGENKGNDPATVKDFWGLVDKLTSINGVTPDENGNVDIDLDAFAKKSEANEFTAENTFKEATNFEKLPLYTGDDNLDIDAIPGEAVITKDLMQIAISRGNGGGQAQLIKVIQITKPVHGEKKNDVLMEFVGAPYESAYDNETRAYREVQIAKVTDAEWKQPIIKKGDWDSFTLTYDERLQPNVEYKLRARDVSTWGTLGNWSQTVIFTTDEDVGVNSPSIISITGGFPSATEVPKVTASVFTTNDGADEHAASQWVLSTVDGRQLWDSGEDEVNLTSVTIPRGNLQVSSNYEIKVRYKGRTYGWSDWGRANFTTAATFTYIRTPSITVENEPNNVLEDPILNANEFEVVTDVGEQDEHVSTSWRIETLDGDTVWEKLQDPKNLRSAKVPHGHLKPNTQYRVKCKYFGKIYESAWGVKEVTTGAEFSRIAMPELTVTGAPDNIPDTPTLKGTAFTILPTNRDTDTHVSSTWEIWNEHDNVKLWSAEETGEHKTSITVPGEILKENGSYIFKLTYHGQKFAASKTARVIGRTANTFTYVEDPTLTVPGAPSDVRERPTLTATEFKLVSATGEADTHASTDWIVEDLNSGEKVFNQLQDKTNKTSIKLPYGVLKEDTYYKFQVRYNTAAGRASNVVSVIAKTHIQLAKIEAPTLTVQGYPQSVPKTPELSASAFKVISDNQATDDHVSTDWEIIKVSTGESLWKSYGDEGNKNSIVLTEDVLEELNEYEFRVRFNGREFGSSAWTSVKATTLALFDYVYTPTVRLVEGFEGDNNHVQAQPTFKATEFAYHSSAATSDMQSKSEWKVFAVENPDSPVWTKTITAEEVENGNGLIKFDEVTIGAGALHPSKSYFVTCRYNGAALGWSKSGRFNIRTADKFGTVTAPTVTIDEPTKVQESPEIKLSAFAVTAEMSDYHIASDYEVRTKEGNHLVWSAYGLKHDLLQMQVPKGRLKVSTQYIARARQKGRKFYYSEWGELEFTTADVFIDETKYAIGDILHTTDPRNPSERFGGTWEKLEEGRTLVAAGDTYALKSKGGEAAHALTVDELPAHTHSGSTSSAGNHSHSRGTIGNDLTGTIQGGDNNAAFARGVFSYMEKTGSSIAGNSYKLDKVRFSGSSGFTGSVSSAGDHSHSMSLNNTGGNRAHNNMPPYMAVYIWLRVA